CEFRRDRDLAARANALLFGDERLGRLGGDAGHAQLLLDGVGREAERERPPDEIERKPLLLSDLSEVCGDFGGGSVSHGRSPSCETRDKEHGTTNWPMPCV